MKIETKPNVDWNTSPFDMNNKISKEVRWNLSERFEVAINNLRDSDEFRKLLLKDGWSISAKNNVVFILNSNKNEDLPDNMEFGNQTLNSGALGAKLRKLRDAAWDSEKYSDLAKVEGISLDQASGKITIKVI